VPAVSDPAADACPGQSATRANPQANDTFPRRPRAFAHRLHRRGHDAVTEQPGVSTCQRIEADRPGGTGGRTRLRPGSGPACGGAGPLARDVAGAAGA